MAMSWPARMKTAPNHSSAAIAVRTAMPKRYSRKSPTVRRSRSAATRRIAGPIHIASATDPTAAEPTHQTAASPSR